MVDFDRVRHCQEALQSVMTDAERRRRRGEVFGRDSRRSICRNELHGWPTPKPAHRSTPVKIGLHVESISSRGMTMWCSPVGSADSWPQEDGV